MRQEYTNIFYDIVESTTEKYGYCIPSDAQAYVTILLGHYLDKHNFLPEDSFAEHYLQLTESNPDNAKQLGDTCLFVCGVFPNYGRKRGLSISYYSDIGKGSYDIAGRSLNSNLFSTLSQQFDVFVDLINVITYNKNSPDIWNSTR